MSMKPKELDDLARRVTLRIMAQARQSSRKLSLPTGNYDEDDIPDDIEPDDDGICRPEPHLYIRGAWDAYMKAHDYRKSARHIASVTASFNSFLTSTQMHENMRLYRITKEAGRRWIISMNTPSRFAPRRAVPKACTISVRLAHVRYFLQWCVAQDWLQENAFEHLTLPARVVSASRTRKEALSDPELSTIFQAITTFSQPMERHAATTLARVEFMHLCRLLAYTGARLTEILQLDRADVRQVDGVWVVAIEEGGDKHIKNATSKRVVPIHSALLPTFLEWHQHPNGQKVFPVLHARGSHIVSRWFSFLLRRTGTKRPALSLHSLRHTMTHKLIQARTHTPLQNRLLGHVIVKGVESRYAAGYEFTVKELSEALELITMPASLLLRS
jgi:integrase